MVVTYETDFSKFFLWTPNDEVCILTSQYKTENPADGIEGFTVSQDEEGGLICPFISEQGWTFASYTFDEDTNQPVSIIGPNGYDWTFVSQQEFSETHEDK